MRNRLLPKILFPAVAAAAVAAVFITGRSPAAPPLPSDTPAAAPADNAGAPSGALPPNHPHVPGMSPHGTGGMPVPNGDNQQPASLTWTAPKTWQTQPNPNAMRLATYKAGDADVSIARAGGTTEANVKRWTDQFASTPKVTRSDKTVHGLPVTVVRIDGSFLGGGMGGAPENHAGWSMLAAIVESSGSPYFFKVLGPSAQVDGARTSFDALIDSIQPRSGD